ncbi:MAG: hypothetical protein ACXW3F_18600, partial [Pyrinomonadaceae bacterium]
DFGISQPPETGAKVIAHHGISQTVRRYVITRQISSGFIVVIYALPKYCTRGISPKETPSARVNRGAILKDEG